MAPLELRSALDLFAVAGSLTSALDLDYLLQQVGAAAESLVDSEASAILLVSDDGERLYFKVATGEKGRALRTMSLPIGQGISGWVAKSRKPELVNDVRGDPRFAAEFDKVSGFVTRSALCVPMAHNGELVGVLEVLNNRAGAYSQEHVGLLSGLAAFAATAIAQTKALAEQKNFFSHALDLLALAVETTRPRMEGHSARAAKLARALGRAMGVSPYQYRMLYYAGMLHDVGYLALRSPESLADMGILQPTEESHPVLSVKLLEGITLLAGALPFVLHHHERYDGSGYPDRLAGEAIPLGARILGLVESVEELRMLGLRGAELYGKAKAEVEAGAGSLFDPAVARAFIELLEAKGTAW